MRHEEFCVDYVAGDRFGAVSCDACTKVGETYILGCNMKRGDTFILGCKM